MILKPGGTINVVHRPFIGVVEGHESRVVRASGNVYTVDLARLNFVRRPELRTRLISVVAGDVFVNVIPDAVNLERIVYLQEKRGIRVTDRSDWRVDLSEYTRL